MESHNDFNDMDDLPEKMEHISMQTPPDELLTSPVEEEASSNPWAESAPDSSILSKRISAVLEPEILEQSAKQLEMENDKEATVFEAAARHEVPKDVLNEFDPLADREEQDARDAWYHAESHPPISPTKPVAVTTVGEGLRQDTSSPGPSTSASFPSTLASFLVPRSFSLNRTRPRPQSQTIDSPPIVVSASSLQSFADQQQKPRSSGESTRVTTVQSADQSSLKLVNEGDKGKPPPFDFQKFLDQMKMKGAEPVAKYLRSFLSNFAKRTFTLNEQVKVIREFLGFISLRMRESDVWRNGSEAEFDNAMEAMEKLVMNRLYDFTFTPQLSLCIPPRLVTTDDLERDSVLSQRIALFGWIEGKHLDVPEGESQGFLDFAQQELLKINHYKAPRDKLICILNCCKVIFGLIRHMHMDEGADAFVPILIFVVLKANPPQLLSNVEYINRFRNPEKLRSEAGYYLSSLMGAISFIESMDHTSLSNITAEEFEKNVEQAVRKLPKDPDDPDAGQSRPSTPSSSTAAGRSTVPPMPPTSPHAGEESAQPLALSAPGPSLSDDIGTSLADDTRRFLQKTGDTISKPLNALGRIFSEALDGAEGRLTYLPGPFAPYDLGKEGRAVQEGQITGGDGQMQAGLFQTPYKPRVRPFAMSPPPQSSGASTPSQAASSSFGFGYTPDGTPTRGGELLSQQPSLPVGLTHALPPHIAQELASSTPNPSRTPTPNLDIAGLQAQIDRAHEQAAAAALGTLNQIFPGMENEVLGLVLEANEGDLGKSIEALLEMSSGN